MPAKKQPQTIGQLRKSRYKVLPVRDEMRKNLIAKIRAEELVFPGIIGFDDTVIPQIVNALLSQHNFIVLGLRGQAKSRILRALIDLLDETIPVVAGCEINDDPLAPVSVFVLKAMITPCDTAARLTSDSLTVPAAA